MTLNLSLTLAMCSFPTTFSSLAISFMLDGGILIAAILIFLLAAYYLRLKRIYNISFLCLAAPGILWAFVMAFVTNRNILVCAGIPNASAALIKSAGESYNTLLFFQQFSTGTHTLTLILILLGISIFIVGYRHRDVPFVQYS